MNFTKRYFKLRDDIVQAINDSGLPVLAAEQCLRELRAELAAIVERELRAEDADAAAEQNGGSSDPLRHGCAVPPPLGHQGEAEGEKGE